MTDISRTEALLRWEGRGPRAQPPRSSTAARRMQVAENHKMLCFMGDSLPGVGENVNSDLRVGEMDGMDKMDDMDARMGRAGPG